jgi:PKD repeat protein
LAKPQFPGVLRPLVMFAVVLVVGGSQSLTELPGAASATTISYVGRLASAKSSSTSTTLNLATVRAVPAGHALLVAAMLNGSSSGTVSAGDAAGNVYTVDRDQADGSGDRVVVFSSLNVKALASGAAITVSFPSSAASYVTVDEFAGLAALDGSASVSGATKTFNSGNATTTQAGELLFGAVGQTAAGGSSWSSGWTALASLAVSGRRLSPAFQIAGAAGSYSASGTASGTWMAALTTYTAAPPPEAAPVAALTVNPTSGTAPLAVAADASASTDVDTTPISSYTFNFGDGSAAVGPQAGATASHTYTATGTFTVTVTVTDTGGLSSTKSTTVTVGADAPPVAKLTVTPSSGAAPLSVTADASASTDTDSTKISSYTFNFGDGSGAVGPQAGATATHTYTSTGTFTVTATVTDSAGLSSTTSTNVTVSTDAPPVAKLTVTPSSGAAPLSVTADASASTDTDSTKISSYTFNFGDGSATVGPQAGATATHTYTSTGTFTATVTVTDSAGLSSSTTGTVTVSFTSSPSVGVYAGYYDTHHDDSHLQPKPNPWSGSPNVVFVGTPDSSSGGWDTSAVMVQNNGSSSVTVTVTVDIGSNHYALWGSRSIPTGQSLILAQTAFENFDGSDTNTAGCYGCDPTLCTTAVLTTIPVVHVTIGGTTTNYPDSKQIINTQGADKAGCPDTGGTRNDESETWQQLSTG